MAPDSTHKTQGRLLLLAALFLGLFALALTLAPAARARSWNVDYRWSHWLGFAVWLVGFSLVHQWTRRRLSSHDPLLVPLIALLSGWGLLTIWRLTTYYGMRQTLWLALALFFFALGLRLPTNLYFLRRYKYLWLTGGLILTALTLLLGTNPLGYGPRLWLGCCGVYMQPSEPLKLLLIVFLAAYFADWLNVIKISGSDEPLFARLQILVPTLIMAGLALLLLVVQRDLGTASLFIFIYTVMVFLATGWRWIPAISVLVLSAAGALGYLLFDVVQLRIEAWINPWLDPTGRSYQIVQSLLSIANGGVFGRGPGLGYPTLVPVSHSDFIFSAVAEETGLVGILGLLALSGFLVHRGLLIALRTPDTYRQLLAAGLTAFVIGQSVLIIGGNLRLLPLTGVTLPFVSYGGSSLMVSFLVALLLLLISAGTTTDHPPLITGKWSRSAAGNPVTQLSGFLLAAILSAAVMAGWWAYFRGPDLLLRTDNPRRALDDRYVARGALLARGDTPLAQTAGEPGDLQRSYSFPALGPISGYNHPVYGQSGLEASLDPTLRGLAGNDRGTVIWHHLLYGQSPPGLDIRLTIDMELQNLADDLMKETRGALILVNAETGEILVMSSHPGFDPNQLDEQWDELVQDPLAPLINRVTQGSYVTGDLAAQPFMQAAADPQVGRTALRLPLADTRFPEEATPLDVVFAAASLSNAGIRPAARLALSYQHPEQDWQLLPLLGTQVELLSDSEVNTSLLQLQSTNSTTWHLAAAPTTEELTWYLSGTIQKEPSPLTLLLVLEEENIPLARQIGEAVLASGINR